MKEQEKLLKKLEFKKNFKVQVKNHKEHDHIFKNLLGQHIERTVRHDIVDTFWSHLPAQPTENLYEPLMRAVEFLYKSSKAIYQSAQFKRTNDNEKLREKIRKHIHVHILSTMPHHTNIYLLETYSQAFKAFLNLVKRQAKQQKRDNLKQQQQNDGNSPSSSPSMEVDENTDLSTSMMNTSVDEDDYDDFTDNAADETGNDAEFMASNKSKNICRGCDKTISDDSEDYSQCVCQSIYDQFCQMNDQLRDLGLLSQLVGDAVISVVKKFTEKRIRKKCSANFSSSFINELSAWVEDTVICWIREVYGQQKPRLCSNLAAATSSRKHHGRNQPNNCLLKEFRECEDSGKAIKLVEERLNYFLYNTYADIRVQQLFDIMLDYPFSEAAIRDLRNCLDQSASPSFRLSLISSLKQSFVKRLLHPGINTTDILTAYISAIKALRALDPSGLILQLVAEPVRKYLKSRDDTVRCIITALTDEKDSELKKEMIKSSSQASDNCSDGQGTSASMNFIDCDGEKITSENWHKWKPDPIDIGSTIEEPLKTNRSSDVVSILVNIYESKDLFVEEYQKLLGQRLLTNFKSGNLYPEIQNLELLTLRFSDCELHRCEVMLKDIQESHRINKRIASGEIVGCELTDFKDFEAIIVSSCFWPEKSGLHCSINDDIPNIKFPPNIEAAIERYTKAFETIKGSRTLLWRHHLGEVNLNLEIGGQSYNFKVSPLHAAIIYQFEQKPSWKLSELAQTMSLPTSMLRFKLTLWIRSGIIRKQKEDTYELIDEQASNIIALNNQNGADLINPDISNDLSRSNANIQEVHNDDFTNSWIFIMTMLRSIGGLELDRIDKYLDRLDTVRKMSREELKQQLQAKIDAGQLMFDKEDCKYKLVDNK